MLKKKPKAYYYIIHNLYYFNNLNVCAVLDQLRALDKKRFFRFEGQLSSHEMSLIDDGLRQVLAI
jgi:hypothetical protein